MLKTLWLAHPDNAMCDAFRRRFDGLPGVRVIRGMFEELEPHDAFVTAGNAFGIMTAGIDAAVVRYFGESLMHRVQQRIMEGGDGCPATSKIRSSPTNSDSGRSCLTVSRSQGVMEKPRVRATVSIPKRRLRFGMRGLLGAVLLLGLVFGWLARMQRQAGEQEALVAELGRDRVVVNRRDPTLLCLVLSKLLRERTILPDTPARFSKWLSPGWFSRPVGFNAGSRLRDEEVPRVVERLQRLGEVHEVQFRGGSLNGLRLFYIGKIPYSWLGPEGVTCAFKVYPASGATPRSLPREHP